MLKVDARSLTRTCVYFSGLSGRVLLCLARRADPITYFSFVPHHRRLVQIRFRSLLERSRDGLLSHSPSHRPAGKIISFIGSRILTSPPGALYYFTLEPWTHLLLSIGFAHRSVIVYLVNIKRVPMKWNNLY